MEPKDRDSLHRFLFEQLPVRGEIAHLDASWRAALEQVDYPPVVRDLLGEAMAAVVLLASTIKFEGSLTLQLQGGNPVTLLVVQCTDRLNLRGIAHWKDPLPDAGAPLRDLIGDDARLAVTIEQKKRNERYQGIVPLEGETLAECFEQYFLRSEQLPTRLFLAADGNCAAGMLLQVMPGKDDTRDAWQHVTTLGETVRADELLGLDAPTIIHRLYNEDDVRLFESTPVAFRCSCSRDRTVGMLRALGEKEVREILAEQGHVEVNCEFCGRKYVFDAVDVEALLASDLPAEGTRTPQ
ncbi:MAG TPA: Hsp33 family molecular chaperone HslO [Gammaproteobacteria bacterium]|nr:Hsp33 family molecular chaperone HslO [Gammaproteobacteria bacterium]